VQQKLPDDVQVIRLQIKDHLEAFVLTLRYGELPLVNGARMDLDGYNTFDSPYLNSPWDSGIVKLWFGPYRLTMDVSSP
jgi:hypothetical protein